MIMTKLTTKKSCTQAANDAQKGLNLIVESLPTLLKVVDKEKPMGPWVGDGFFCGRCEYPLDVEYKYCPECGQKINWLR